MGQHGRGSDREKRPQYNNRCIYLYTAAAAFAVILFKQINPRKFTLPFYLLVMGIFFFSTAMESDSKLGEWLASLSWTLNMLGFVLFYQYLTGNLQSWIYLWPLFFPFGIGLEQVCYGAVKPKKSPLSVGKYSSRWVLDFLSWSS